MAESIPTRPSSSLFSTSSSTSSLPPFHLPTSQPATPHRQIPAKFHPKLRISASVAGAAATPAEKGGRGRDKLRYEIENLTTWLLKRERAGQIDAELTIVLSSISLACKQIASLLQRSNIINLTGAQGTVNVQGEDQKKLDVISNELFCNCLRSSGRTGIIASEEEDVPVAVEETYSGNYIVVFDPIDGSANIDISLTTGSIFGIYGPEEQCLADYDDDTLDQGKQKCLVSVCQPGTNLLAAGYCLYSSSVVFTLSIGTGIYMRKSGRIYSFNEGNYNLFDSKLQNYLQHLRKPGPNGKPYSGRYIGCLVGEVHRMLLYGGIYGNPDNKKATSGNLRLLYECAPMSYLIEQAGGKAIDGHRRILDIKPEQIHQRTPIFIGSPNEIEKLEMFLA